MQVHHARMKLTEHNLNKLKGDGKMEICMSVVQDMTDLADAASAVAQMARSKTLSLADSAKRKMERAHVRHRKRAKKEEDRTSSSSSTSSLDEDLADAAGGGRPGPSDPARSQP